MCICNSILDECSIDIAKNTSPTFIVTDKFLSGILYPEVCLLGLVVHFILVPL